jgi:hypothetical protein
MISLVAGLGIAGCNLDSNLSGIGKSLLDPDAQGVESPGRRLMEGPHYNLRLVRSETGERYLLSRTSDNELSVYNLTSGDECKIPNVLGTSTVSSPGQKTLIAFIAPNTEGAPELAFSDFSCQVGAPRVQTNTLPPSDNTSTRYFTGLATGSGVGVLFRVPNNKLLLLDPWSDSQRIVQDDIAGEPLLALDRWWWRNAGQLVMSDSELEPLGRVGKDIGDWDISPDLQELAYIERTEGERGLYVARAPDFRPELIDAEACDIAYLRSTAMLAYFSPCSARRLVLNDRRAGSTRALAENVLSSFGAPVIRLVRDRKLYLTNTDPDQGTGALWLVQGEQEPVQIGDNSRLDYRFMPDGGLLAVVDWTETGGRLIYWKDGESRDIAEGVYELGNLGVLVNFDGRTGDLVRLNADLSPTVVATGVPDGASINNVVLGNFDGRTGDLLLVDEATNETELIASGVPQNAFRFTIQFDALYILSDHDPGSNTSSLLFHLLDTDQDFVVNAGVSEAVEVSFPSAGFVYSVVTGDAQGVYFAKVL